MIWLAATRESEWYVERTGAGKQEWEKDRLRFNCAAVTGDNAWCVCVRRRGVCGCGCVTSVFRRFPLPAGAAFSRGSVVVVDITIQAGEKQKTENGTGSEENPGG